MKQVSCLVLVLALVSSISFSEEVIIAEEDILSEIAVGNDPNQVSYFLDDEGFYSPKGPMIGQKGELVFLPNSTNDKIQVFFNGKWSDFPVSKEINLSEILNRQMASCGGFSYNQSGFQFIYSFGKLFYYNYYYITNEYYNLDKSYSAPFGIIQYSEKIKEGLAVIFDVEKPTKNFSIIDWKKLTTWLPTQPGGFSIGSDGLLYRNGIVWSAIKPKGFEKNDWRYLGRLMSGHPIWCMGPPEWATAFTITEADGTIALKVDLQLKVPETRFNWGLGPWGELYYLMAPPMDKKLDPLYDKYSPEPGVPAELVVVRNHLKYFGRLNDSNVRLRKEPNTTSEVLGTYPNKTGFRILERTGKEETIAGQKSDWVKVRLLDGTEGWFFGAFVHNLYDGPNGNPPPWPNVPDW